VFTDDNTFEYPPTAKAASLVVKQVNPSIAARAGYSYLTEGFSLKLLFFNGIYILYLNNKYFCVMPAES